MSSNTKVKHESGGREHAGAPPTSAAQPDRAAYTSSSVTTNSQPATEVAGVNRPSPATASQPPVPHGYTPAAPAQVESHIHPELRSGHEPVSTNPVYAPVPTMMPSGVPPPPEQTVAMSGPPAAGPPSTGMINQGESAADGRKAKRELSQSKRAAQNRAAQRAFRQRKEGHIKKLEQQVRDYAVMEINYKELQAENYALREYVIHLQARLLDAQGEYPPPPASLSLPHPHSLAPAARGGAETTQPAVPAPGANPLEVAAQAVAGLNRSDHLAGRDQYAVARPDDDARTAEEITRQLQAEGTPDGLPAAPM